MTRKKPTPEPAAPPPEVVEAGLALLNRGGKDPWQIRAILERRFGVDRPTAERALGLIALASMEATMRRYRTGDVVEAHRLHFADILRQARKGKGKKR